MIVDTHVHVWEIDPPRYPVGPTAPGFTGLPDEPATAGELLAEMDGHGVDWTVLVQTSWSTWDNGYIADSVQAHPDRFIGMGLVDPQDPGNAQLARYWLQDRGLAGFRLHPMYYPDEPVLTKAANQPLWEEIEALEAVVQLHMQPQFADQVDAIARRHPQVTLIIDHLGYPSVDQAQAPQPLLDLARLPNLRLKLSDVAGRSQQAYPFRDMHGIVSQLVGAFGAERTMWGTGYPGHHRTKHNWPTLERELALIQEGLPFLTAAQRERILGGTAAEVWQLR